MIVSELIEILQKLPQDMKVVQTDDCVFEDVLGARVVKDRGVVEILDWDSE